MAELHHLVEAARRSPGPTPLVCPCGGNVRLDGWAVTGSSVRYLCDRCGAVVTSLAGLVVAVEPRPRAQHHHGAAARFWHFGTVEGKDVTHEKDRDLTEALFLCTPHDTLLLAPAPDASLGLGVYVLFTNVAAVVAAKESGVFGNAKDVYVTPACSCILEYAAAAGIRIIVNPVLVDGNLRWGVLEWASGVALSPGGSA